MLRRLRFLGLSLAAVAALGACSSSSSKDDAATGPTNPTNTRVGDVHGADVWKDGLVLTGIVTIAKDADVEIAPGAKITCAEGSTLYVQGKLHAKAAGSHAKITCGKWAGLVVSAGGRADLEGVELETGLVGIATATGAVDSTFTEGVITNALKPFVVSSGTKLTVTKAKVTQPQKVGPSELAQSEIEGFLVASRLDYETFTSEGIRVGKGGQLDLQDSTVHGKNGQDLVSAYDAKHLKIAYSTFTGAHCGLHIQPSESFEIDHVTSDSDIFGITIYGSGAGPNTIKSSNFTGTSAWLDFQGFDQGKISFDNVYTSGMEVMLGTPPVSVTGKSATPIADAKPR